MTLAEVVQALPDVTAPEHTGTFSDPTAPSDIAWVETVNVDFSLGEVVTRLAEDVEWRYEDLDVDPNKFSIDRKLRRHTRSSPEGDYSETYECRVGNSFKLTHKLRYFTNSIEVARHGDRYSIRVERPDP